MRSIVLVATTLVALTAFTSIPARADGAWCAYYVRGGTNCGFHTYEQCRLNISGIGGTCSRNPNYPPSNADSRRRY